MQCSIAGLIWPPSPAYSVREEDARWMISEGDVQVHADAHQHRRCDLAALAQLLHVCKGCCESSLRSVLCL